MLKNLKEKNSVANLKKEKNKTKNKQAKLAEESKPAWKRDVISDDPVRDCGSCAFVNCVTHSLRPKQKSSEEKISREQYVSRVEVVRGGWISDEGNQ